MKRQALVMLIAASVVGGAEAEAQRGRDHRDQDNRTRNRVQRLEPVRAPGRVAAPAYRAGPHRAGRGRVVYSTRRYRPGYRAHGAWVRVDWGHAVRYRPVVRQPRRAFLRQGDLKHLLGKRMVRNIKDAGRSVGLRGSLRGEWVQAWGSGTVLVVTMGGSEVAELIDFDRDGYMDEVYLIGPHGYRPVVYGR